MSPPFRPMGHWAQDALKWLGFRTRSGVQARPSQCRLEHVGTPHRQQGYHAYRCSRSAMWHPCGSTWLPRGGGPPRGGPQVHHGHPEGREQAPRGPQGSTRPGRHREGDPRHLLKTDFFGLWRPPSSLPSKRPPRPLSGPQRPLWKPERPLWRLEKLHRRPEKSFCWPEKLLWRPEKPLWRPEKPLWRPPGPLWRPPGPLWRPSGLCSQT